MSHYVKQLHYVVPVTWYRVHFMSHYLMLSSWIAEVHINYIYNLISNSNAVKMYFGISLHCLRK